MGVILVLYSLSAKLEQQLFEAENLFSQEVPFEQL